MSVRPGYRISNQAQGSLVFVLTEFFMLVRHYFFLLRIAITSI